MPNIVNHKILLNIMCFGYVFTSIGLVGVPGYSRLALVFSLVLAIMVALGGLIRKLQVGNWVMLPIAFYFYAIVLSYEAPGGWEELGSLFTVWIGSVAVGVAVQNGAKKKLIIITGGIAVLASFVAFSLGFEAFNIYGRSAETGIILISRISGLMGNPNTLAISAGTLVFLSFALLDGNTKLKLVLVASFFYSVILSGSRNGLLGFLLFSVLIIFYSFFYNKKFRKEIFVGIGIITFGLASFGVGWFFNYGSEVEAVKRMQAISGGEASFEERIELIQIGWDLFLANPVFGYGLDSFRDESGTNKYSHNNYIELLVSGGMVFFLLMYIHHLAIIFQTKHFLPQKRFWVIGFVLFILIQDMGAVSYQSRPIILGLILVLAEVWICTENQIIMS